MNNKKEIYYQYFEERILPLMLPYEQYRLKIVRKIFVSSIFMFLAGIIFAFLFILISVKYNGTILLLPIFLFGMYVFFIKSIINAMWEGKKYQKWLIENILPYFLEPVANFKFWPKNSDTESILNSNIFGNFDSREDESAIFGIYNNTNIKITNTSLTIPLNRNMFKGTIIQLELSKAIDNHIILISKNERKFNRFKQVNPKIKELNKYLYTFSKNDDISLVNDSFWQIIKRIGELYVAKGFSFSYNNGVVLIGLRQKYPWQFGFVFKSLLKAKNYDELIERFTVIYDLIDCLTDFVQ